VHGTPNTFNVLAHSVSDGGKAFGDINVDIGRVSDAISAGSQTLNIHYGQNGPSLVDGALYGYKMGVSKSYTFDIPAA
jgi:hypothetical protein